MRRVTIALLAAAVAMPAAAADKKQDDADRLICKRFVETGSLVRAKKQCFTRAQWDEIAASQRAGWEKTRDELTGKSLGGP